MNETQTMLLSEARVATTMPRRYLGQLCKHFQHKLPVTLEALQGRIEFPAGVCELDAATTFTLILRVSAGDAAGLASLEDVVARHLKRFAVRDELEVQWTRTA